MTAQHQEWSAKQFQLEAGDKTVVACVATFKKMYSQEKVRQMKAFEKQEKQLKEMKAAGKSSKQAVSVTGQHVELFVPSAEN